VLEQAAHQDKDRSEDMKHPTCKQIAANKGLWDTYANPSACVPFESMTYEARLEMIHEVWPSDCNCNDDNDDDNDD
jgi:hypothetical protein